MKALLSRSICLSFGLLIATQTIHARPIERDSLPAGSKVSIDIALPGDKTTTKIQYVVPTSAAPVAVVKPPVIIQPDPIVFSVAQTITKQSGTVGEAFSFTIPSTTFSGNVTGIDVSDLPAGLSYNSTERRIAGTPTREDSRLITVSATDGKTIAQTSFLLTIAGSSGTAPSIPTVPNVPDPVGTTPGPTANVVNNAVSFAYSTQPNRVNRMQAPVQAPYQDGWKMKQWEVITGGNGGITETPDDLRKRGHNWFNAQWFYGSDDRPFGYPKPTDNLFFEYNGNNFAPYHTDAYRAVVEDFNAAANTITSRMQTWNTIRENGLIDGVATVKEASFNIEYYWFLQSDWDKLSQSDRDRSYYNYASNVQETLQQTYNRGGIDAIQQAQHQKWNNLIAVTVLYLNKNSNGMKAFYGDFWGLSNFHNLRNWNKRVSPTELLTANVNDPALFPEANESANAGNVTLFNGQTFDVSGNLNQLQGRRNVYNYEWDVTMTAKDFQDYFSIGRDAPADRKNINDWYAKIRPDLDRPYDIVYHALLQKAIARQKGWLDFRFYWQVQSIYEHSILIPEQGWREATGAWVPWTLNNPNPTLRNTKIPLHPEVAYNLTVMARFVYDGLYKWGSGCCARINPDASVGENVNPDVHLVSREAEQSALSDLGIYNEIVFTADKRTHITDVPVLAPSGQFISGDPSILQKANAPLVIGVDSPSTGWELYFVYYPNGSRDGQTSVKWKSPVDGKELSGTANGWKGSLYARKR